MVVDAEKKREASMPVQSRIDIRTLAELAEYWGKEGVYIKTMSQLVSWSLDICREILKSNGKIEEPIETVGEAYVMLEERGLYQAGMKKRMMQKANTARSFENLRMEGVDPKEYTKQQYNMIHNKHSVQAVDPDLVIAAKKQWEEEMKKKEEKLNKYEGTLDMTRSEESEDKTDIVETTPHYRQDVLVEDVEEVDEEGRPVKVRRRDGKNDDRLKHKSSAELDAEGERIRKKDEQMLRDLEMM